MRDTMCSMKILVVEDDPEMRTLLEQGLTAEGYELTLVNNGVDALIAVRKTEFAAAAIDVMLPGMSGFEICRHVRETNSRMPILLNRVSVPSARAGAARAWGYPAPVAQPACHPHSVRRSGI